MNFDMGAEKADEEDDIRVETVLVTDDVVSSENIPDRRGICNSSCKGRNNLRYGRW